MLMINLGCALDPRNRRLPSRSHGNSKKSLLSEPYSRVVDSVTGKIDLTNCFKKYLRVNRYRRSWG